MSGKESRLFVLVGGGESLVRGIAVDELRGIEARP
jgi:hypothetical protein